MRRRLSFALLLTACFTLTVAADAAAAPELTQLAQAQPAPAPAPAAQTPAAPAPAAPVADSQQAAAEPIGNVATLTGSATVTRNNASTPLQLRDDIFANDVVETAAKSKLGITFNDATTFNLSASAKITIDSYVYQEGGTENGALFDVAKGTVAFVAASVAKTGDMRISTPTATLGIRGTTGLIEVPEGATATSTNVAIKLYPDADGKVGRIEVNDRSGARIGALTQGASGFAIRPGTGGARFAAVPLTLSPQQVARDQGFVRQVHTAQNLGRQVVEEQRTFRRANPGVPYPNRGQPVQPRPQQPNAVPGQNRTTPPQPGQPNRPEQPQQPGQQNRPGQPGLQNRPGQPQQPGTPNRQGSTQPQPGSPQPGQNAATPRPNSLPGQPGGTPLPPSGQQQGGQPPAGQQQGVRQQGSTRPSGQPAVQQPNVRQGVQQPGVRQPGVQQPSAQPPGARPPATPQPAAPPPAVPQQAQPRPPGAAPGVPGLQRPGLQNRPALAPRRLPPPPKGKLPREKRRG
jgi:FecR protein